jgi:hypothetical protein
MLSHRLVQKRGTLVLVAVVVAFAVGGMGGAGQGNLAAAPQPGVDEKLILLGGHWAARQVFASWNAPTEVVAAATALNGGKLALTGTLTSADGQPSKYDAAPADRLIWKPAGPKAREYFITTLKGDLGDGAKKFFGNPHTLKYRVVIEGEMDLEVDATRAADGFFKQRYEQRIKGWMLYGGQKYKIDLTRQGTWYFENDNTGFEARDDHTITGTVVGPAVELTVAETSRYVAVNAERTTVSFDVYQHANKIVAGGKTYQWDKVLLKKNFKNGVPSNTNNDWVCEGRVLVDGQPFATYAKGVADGKVVYRINGPGGALELGRW